MRWNEVISDPSLKDLPYKVELSKEGKIEMSPASNRHGYLQSRIAYELQRQLGRGGVITECSIQTDIGVRVPDVAWASDDFLARFGFDTPYLAAPEICVEIMSPANSEAEMATKARAYFALGAMEVWVVSEAGEIRYFDKTGQRPASSFGVVVAFPQLTRQ
jgi:Uma2 family endonuclease